MGHEHGVHLGITNQAKEQNQTFVTFAPPTFVDALRFYPSAFAVLEGMPLGLYKLGDLSPEPMNHILHSASVILEVIDNLALGYITKESIKSFRNQGDRYEHWKNR